MATATPSVFTQVPFKATDVRKQYGLTIGGLLVRDKLLFFVAADRFARKFPGFGALKSGAVYTAPAANATNIASLATALGVSTACNYGAQQCNQWVEFGAGKYARTGDQTVYFPKIDWQINERNQTNSNSNGFVYSPRQIQLGARVQF